MTQYTPKGIWIITDETVEVEDGKGGVDIGADYGDSPSDDRSVRKRSHISAEDLKQNIGEFIEVVEESFDRAESSKSKLQLEEIELSVEISGSGKVSLLGFGGDASAKGAVKLKFTRKDG
ncbi:hypothetical protein VB774_09665 [Pseudanabaena galeata UHCC 0370]|uniref:Pepco domain-containing protein n=1 Tax=Pseudanabaena galeata UHCC 0370 TaxID=3110310 RepID=A0ABU5TI67_9CYAN|nr:hypothetical protein [Pseudanabaena galeata]MEA5477885.1 hypothetical protein [Pseudanabaena galeata UHCC 0370]